MRLPRVRVAGMLVRSAKVLLISHKKKDKEYWLLPGGGLESGETIVETLVREFWEELHCHIEIGDLLYITEVKGKERHIIQFIFSVKTDQEDFIVGDEPILGNYNFFDSEQLENAILYPNMKEPLLHILRTGKKMDQVYHSVEWQS